MGQNPKYPGYIKGKNQGDKLKYIFSVYSFQHIQQTEQTVQQHIQLNNSIQIASKPNRI